MRTFIAVEVPEQIRKVVYDFIQIEARKELPIKWVAFENLHITLKFLGEIDEKKRDELAPVITQIGQKHNGFQVRIEGLGCFPNPRTPRVLWVGVKDGNTELCDIAAALEKGLAPLGFKDEKRFHPHLTIGRIKKLCKMNDILAKHISTDAFRVDSVVLFKSKLNPDGPVYEQLDRFALS
jgi:2'-5' RNA ligase